MPRSSGAGGALTRVTSRLPGGGERRDGQVRMAELVTEAIERRRHLVVAAGTGTGKSLAYLVPSALAGRRVVVATVTKALQDQLADRDLPLVREALADGDDTFTHAVLKGRHNYVCRQRLAELAERGFQAELEVDPDAGDTRRLTDQLLRIVRWAEETPSGDRADLDFEPGARAWGMVSVGRRECPGAFRCPSGPHCFTEAAREAAADADVVVVNTHLYAAHLASGGTVLPPHDVVVFDEAHQLEEVMTSGLGTEIGPGRFRSLAAQVRPLLGEEEARRIAEIGERLGEELAGRVGRRILLGDEPGGGGRGGGRGGEPGGGGRGGGGRGGGGRGGEPGGGGPGGDDDEPDGLRRVLELGRHRLSELGGALRRESGDTGSDDDAEQLRVLVAASNLEADLQAVASSDADTVVWVDGSRQAPLLVASPLDVAPRLASLWDSVTAVLTSATLPPGLARRLGLPEDGYTEADVGSPFDHRRQSLLYVPKRLPDPRSLSFDQAAADELQRLVEAAGGRTLALFTSHRALGAAVDRLLPRLADLGLRVWRQGDLPKERLVRAFAEDETSCLFATLGFWQGLDVPGSSLSVVALDRLPFARPDDPLHQARREKAGPGAFAAVDLPRAATLLAQGAGRLIRTSEDRGVVAVLDRRLATASYRATLLQGLPPMRRTVDFDEVAAFLAGIRGPTGRRPRGGVAISARS